MLQTSVFCLAVCLVVAGCSCDDDSSAGTPNRDASAEGTADGAAGGTGAGGNGGEVGSEAGDEADGADVSSADGSDAESTDAGSDTLPDAPEADATDGSDAGEVPCSALGQCPGDVLLNEVNPNISNQADLVELRVVNAVPVDDIWLLEDVAVPTAVLAVLPSLNVAPGELFVVHLNPTAGVLTETLAKTQCGDSACYPGAWDVRGADRHILHDNRVLAIVADGTIIDAVPFARPSSTMTTYFPVELQRLQAGALWFPSSCSGLPCTYTSTPTAIEVSVDWELVSTTLGGMSVQRTGTSDTNRASDWIMAASTFGAPSQ